MSKRYRLKDNGVEFTEEECIENAIMLTKEAWDTDEDDYIKQCKEAGRTLEDMINEAVKNALSELKTEAILIEE